MGAPCRGRCLRQRRPCLRFALRDGKGETMPVVFKGPKPEDLDSAMSKAAKITAQGTYDPRAQAFRRRQPAGQVPVQVPGRTRRHGAELRGVVGTYPGSLSAPPFPEGRDRTTLCCPPLPEQAEAGRGLLTSCHSLEPSSSGPPSPPSSPRWGCTWRRARRGATRPWPTG